MKKHEEKPIISKIEVDEKTAEPIIVNLSKKELKEMEKQQKYHEHDFVERKTDRDIGKQMKRMFGVNPDEKIANKRKKILKISITAIFVIFVVGVLFVTAYKDFFGSEEGREHLSGEELVKILSNSWIYLLSALVALAGCFTFKGLKLSIMCKSLTGKAHFKTCIETGIIGHYYNNVTPLAVGGQPFEIYHLSKHGVHGGVATSLPLVTFFLNQLAFVVLGVVSLSLIGFNPFSNILPSTISVMAIIGLFACIFMPAIIILFSLLPRVGSCLVKIILSLGVKLKIVKEPKKAMFKTMKTVAHNSRCIKRFATRPLAFNISFLLSFCEQLCSASLAFLTLKLYGFNFEHWDINGIMQWVFTCQIYFILTSAISFIPTPGNSGAADLSFYVLFETGLAVGLAFPAMLTWRILAFYSYLIIGFVFAILKKKADKKKILNNQELA